MKWTDYTKYTYEAEIIGTDGRLSACGHRHRTLRAALKCAGSTGRVHLCMPDGTARNITAAEWDSDGSPEETQRNIER